MQTTKPNIPTKNKNSADPDIRKFRDSEVNAIVAGFQQVDDNFDVVETELVNIAEPDLDQFIEVGGRYTLATPFRKITSNFPTVTTESGKIHGSRNAPQYNFLILPTSLTTAQKQWLNRVKVVHSGLVVPAVLVPNKPTSPLPVYDGLTNPVSPLATYASQAAMTADFASQVLDFYYYYTGSNTAWKYNGTATDSIDNYVPELYMLGDQSAQLSGEYYEYTGSTSMWQKTAASTGAIGDYTELAAIAGWETWGSKPSYLIVQGDAYLVGENNVNELDFVYHELIKISGTSYADVVVVTNIAHSGMNADSDKISPIQAINLEFNEIDDPVVFDSLNNNAYLNELFDPVLINPSEAYYQLLSGSNYAMFMGMTSNLASARSMLEMYISESTIRFFSRQKVTIIARYALHNPLSSSFGVRVLFSNRNNSNFKGFNLSTGNTLGTAGTMSFTVGNGSSGFLLVNMPTPPTILEDGNYITVAMSYEAGASDIGYTLDWYYKSNDYAIPFTNGGQNTSANQRFIDGGETLYLSRLGSGASMRAISMDYFGMWFGKLSQAQIEPIINILEP